MALKGYTNAEAEIYRQKKLVRLTSLMGATHVLLMAVNIVLAFTPYSKAAFVSVVIYLTLFGIYVHGVELLGELGYERIGFFKAFKIVSILVYIVTFIIAILS